MIKRRSFFVCLVCIFMSAVLGFSSLPSISTASTYQAIEQQVFCPTTSIQKTQTITYAYDYENLQVKQQDSRRILSHVSLIGEIVPGLPTVFYDLQTYLIPNSFQVCSVVLKDIKTELIPTGQSPWLCAKSPYSLSIQSMNSTTYTSPSTLYDSSLKQYPCQSFQAYPDQAREDIFLLKLYPIIYTGETTAFFIKEFTFDIQLGEVSETEALSRLDASNPSEITRKGLIITTEDFQNAAQKLQSQQLSNQVISSIVYLSEIASYPERKPTLPEGVMGYEEHEHNFLSTYNALLAYKIHSYILSLFPPPQYITIVGDASIVPPSYYIYSSTEESEYENWIPTDLFYTDLKNTGTLLFDSISIGRIPASTPTQALEMIENSIQSSFEISSLSNPSVLLSGGNPFPADPYFAESVQANTVNQNFFPNATLEKQFTTGKGCTASLLSTSLKQEPFSVVWAFGHGDGSSLYSDTGVVTLEDVYQWPADHRQYLMVSEGCGNASFDSYLLSPPAPSFATALLEAKGGFSNYFGGTRDCWCGWDLTINTGIPTIQRLFYGEALIQYFLSSLSDSSLTLGDSARKAFYTYVTKDTYVYNEAYLKTLFGFTFLGDPTAPNPLSTPETELQVPQLQPFTNSKFLQNDIPVFSVQEDFVIEFDSPSLFINCEFYDEIEKKHGEVIYQPTLRRETGFHYYYIIFTKPLKGNYIVRLSTEEGAESRFFFYARQPHDLVFSPNIDLSILAVTEKKKYCLEIKNEGFSLEKDITLSVFDGDSLTVQKKCEFLSPFSYRKIFLEFAFPEDGERQLTFKIENQYHAQSFKKWMNISSLPITRVGILCAKDLSNRDLFLQQLMIEDLNKDLNRRLSNMELQVIPFANDSQNKTTFDRLHFDIMILYAKNAGDILSSQLLFELIEFEKKGGLVIGIYPFGFPDKSSQKTKLLQSFFGIQDDEKIRPIAFSSQDRKLIIRDKKILSYFRKEYRLNLSCGLIPAKKSWGAVGISPSTRILGLSEDTSLVLLQNKNRILFSGFLQTESFNSFDDSYSFFLDLLNYAKDYAQQQKSFVQTKQTTSYEPTFSSTNSVYPSPPSFPMFVSSTIFENDKIWISGLHGFYVAHINKPDQYSFYPYPDALIRSIGPSLFRQEVSTPSKTRFRLYNNQVLFHCGNSLYLFDPFRVDTPIITIPHTLFDTFITPIQQYDTITDIEILNDSVYILSNICISVLNIPTGRIQYTIPLSHTNGIDLTVYANQLYVLTSDNFLLVIDPFGSTYKKIPINTPQLEPLSFYIVDRNAIYVFYRDKEGCILQISINSYDECIVQNKIMFQSTVIGSMEQFFIRNNKLGGVFLDTYAENQFVVKGTWILYNIQTQKTLSSSLDDLHYYNEMNHSLFANEVWMLKDRTLLVSQQLPIDAMFDIYSQDPFQWQGSIKIADYAPKYSIVDAEYTSSGYLYVLMENEQESILLRIDPLHSTDWKITSLEGIKPSDIQSFSLNENRLIVYSKEGYIDVFDLETGHLKSKFLPVSSEKEKFPCRVSQIIAGTNAIWLYDSIGNRLFSFTYYGELLNCRDFTSFSSRSYSSIQLLGIDYFALLDSSDGTIQLLLQDKLTTKYTIGGFPISAIVSDKRIIVNDYYLGFIEYSR